MVKPDLAVTLGPLALRNPVLAASGTFGYGLEFLPFLAVRAEDANESLGEDANDR